MALLFLEKTFRDVGAGFASAICQKDVSEHG